MNKRYECALIPWPGFIILFIANFDILHTTKHNKKKSLARIQVLEKSYLYKINRTLSSIHPTIQLCIQNKIHPVLFKIRTPAIYLGNCIL